MTHWEYIFIPTSSQQHMQLPLLVVQESDTKSYPSLWKCHSLTPAQQLQCIAFPGNAPAIVQTDILNIYFWNFSPHLKGRLVFIYCYA